MEIISRGRNTIDVKSGWGGLLENNKWSLKWSDGDWKKATFRKRKLTEFWEHEIAKPITGIVKFKNGQN